MHASASITELDPMQDDIEDKLLQLMTTVKAVNPQVSILPQFLADYDQAKNNYK
jgi:hypothetical protein